ncbi:YbaK/EbsC family protein [Labedella populi]|uniref:YbaK/EbsC family protein n=1 Tax=Labedella populi TaxID=2498850 RepID=A0A444QDL5_9MICO|nr:YbaK/EbsC family protein [Labedella populi]RWZ64757.1 YbaK/EbsC family protein [Labedella populi]
MRRSHPSVERVEAALAAAGTPVEVVWFDEGAHTAVAAATALDCPVGAIANSLVFTLDGEPVLVMTSGAHRVDTAFLGKRIGGRLKRADADTVKAATGQVIGGVAPVGHPAPLRTWVDTALAAFPVIWAAAGHAHTVFPTTFDDLVRLTGGTVTAVTLD